MTKITDFSGGISTKLSAHLIATNEAVISTGVSPVSKSLAPLKNQTDSGVTVDGEFIYFNAEDEWVARTDPVEYVEYQGKLYWTSVSDAKQYDGTDEFNLSVQPPITAVAVETSTVQALSTLGITFTALPDPAGNTDVSDYLTPPAYPAKVIWTDLTVWIVYEKLSGITWIPFHTNKVSLGTIDNDTGFGFPGDPHGDKAAIRVTFNDLNDANIRVRLFCNSPDAGDIIVNAYLGTFTGVRQLRATTETGILPPLDFYADPPFRSSDEFSQGGEQRVWFYPPLDVTSLRAYDEVELAGMYIDNTTYDFIGYAEDDSGTRSADTTLSIGSPATTGDYYVTHLPTGIGADLIAKVFQDFGQKYLLRAIDAPNMHATDEEKYIAFGTAVTQYVYTFYSSASGKESAPSPVSTTADLSQGSAILSEFSISTDLQIDKIRIYRVGGNQTEFGLIQTVNNIQQTVSDTGSTAVTELLTTETHDPIITAARYLTEYAGAFWAAVGTKVYYSIGGVVHAWPVEQFFEFRETVSGLASTSIGILVFTEFETYIITGTSLATFAKRRVSASIGCPDFDSVRYIDNAVIWASHQGLCISAGGVPQVITRMKLEPGDPIVSAMAIGCTGSMVLHNSYYINTTAGLFVFDFDNNAFYTFDVTAGVGLGIKNNILYVDIGGMLYSIGTATLTADLQWKSPEFTEGSISEQKTYKDIYVFCSGTLTEIKVYIDGAEVLSQELITGINNLKVPQDKQAGYHLQFEVIDVTGDAGTIKEIEYKAVGRKNGR